jgi:hypothetical protein
LIRVVSSSPGASATFTCPEGNVVLVKSATFSSNATAVADCFLLVASADSTVLVTPIRAQLEAGASLHWDGWQVLNPGDYVGCYLGESAINAWISGAVLMGPPPFPPTTQLRDAVQALPVLQELVSRSPGRSPIGAAPDRPAARQPGRRP